MQLVKVQRGTENSGVGEGCNWANQGDSNSRVRCAEIMAETEGGGRRASGDWIAR